MGDRSVADVFFSTGGLSLDSALRLSYDLQQVADSVEKNKDSNYMRIVVKGKAGVVSEYIAQDMVSGHESIFSATVLGSSSYSIENLKVLNKNFKPAVDTRIGLVCSGMSLENALKISDDVQALAGDTPAGDDVYLRYITLQCLGSDEISYDVQDVGKNGLVM